MSENKLLPLVELPLMWLLIGSSLIISVILWWTFVFWFTRNRKVKTVSDLKPRSLNLDLGSLKAKYLKIIDEIEIAVNSARIPSRVAHQKLSLAVRLFAFEASGFRAQVMTLSDLEKSRYPSLPKVIREYYPSEFERVDKGEISESIKSAKEIVSRWA